MRLHPTNPRAASGLNFGLEKANSYHPMGAARGTAIIAAAEHGLEVHEYAPRLVNRR